MLKKIAIIVTVIIVNQTYAQKGWYLQESKTDKDLSKVYSYDTNLVWAVGEFGTILFTDDGGNQWSHQTSGTTSDLYSLQFINSDIGWVVGGGGTILNTTNSGNEWKPQESGTELTLRDVHFLDSLTGWVTGGDLLDETGWAGVVLQTIDGGVSWLVKYSDESHTFFDIQFFDFDNGWVAGFGTADPFIAFSSDGGSSWQRRSPSPGINPPLSLYFFDNSNGWVLGELTSQATALLNTLDKGLSWDMQIFPYNLNEIYFLNQDTGLAVGNGGIILVTTDGGKNWIKAPIEFDNDLKSIFFADNNNGWTVGANGTVLHTQTGPIVSVHEDKSSSNSTNVLDFHMDQNYPNPFNASTTIRFHIKKHGVVQLLIYNESGQMIRKLINKNLPGGEHSVVWNGEDDNGKLVASGLYICRLKVDYNNIISKPMILLK